MTKIFKVKIGLSPEDIFKFIRKIILPANKPVIQARGSKQLNIS